MFPITSFDFKESIPSIVQGMNCLVGLPLDELRKKQGFITENKTYHDAFNEYCKGLEARISELRNQFGNNSFARFSTNLLHAAERRVKTKVEEFENPGLVLINSNLSKNNIYMNTDGKVRFTSWGDARIGDPALEMLGFLLSNGLSGESAKNALSKYLAADKHIVDRIYFYEELMKLEKAMDSAISYSHRRESKDKKEFESAVQELSERELTRQIEGHKIIQRQSKDFLEKEKVIPLKDRLKSWGRKALYAGAAALALYAGAYYDQRRPRVVETSQENGATVEIYDKKNISFPAPIFLDYLIWGPMNNTVKMRDGKIITKIDRSFSKLNARTVSKNWDKLVINKESCEKDSPSCDLEELAIYSSLKDVPKERIEQEYFNRSLNSIKVHEERHVLDGVDKYDPINS
jgi:hypothetical protein